MTCIGIPDSQICTLFHSVTVYIYLIIHINPLYTCTCRYMTAYSLIMNLSSDGVLVNRTDLFAPYSKKSIAEAKAHETLRKFQNNNCVCWHFKWIQYWSDPGFSQNQRADSVISNNYMPDKTGAIISKAWRGENQSNFLNNLQWEQRICVLEEKLKKMFLAILILSEKTCVWIREMQKTWDYYFFVFVTKQRVSKCKKDSLYRISMKYSQIQQTNEVMWHSIFIVMISTTFSQISSHRVVSPTWSGLSLRKMQTRLSKFSLAAGSFLLISVMIWKISQKRFQREAGKK